MNNNEVILIKKLSFIYRNAIKNIKYFFVLLILSIGSYSFYIYNTTTYALFYEFEISIKKDFILELYNLGSKVNFCRNIDPNHSFLTACDPNLYTNDDNKNYLEFNILYIEKKILNLVKEHVNYLYEKNISNEKNKDNPKYFNFLNSSSLSIGQNNYKLQFYLVNYQSYKDDNFIDLKKDMSLFVDQTTLHISNFLSGFYTSLDVNKKNYKTECEFNSKYLPGYVIYNHLELDEYLKSILSIDEDPFDYIEQRINQYSVNSNYFFKNFENSVTLLKYIYDHFREAIDCEKFLKIKSIDTSSQINKIIDKKFITFNSYYNIVNKTKYFSIVLFIILPLIIYLLSILLIEIKNSYSKRIND